jgi:hypothetical protein
MCLLLITFEPISGFLCGYKNWILKESYTKKIWTHVGVTPMLQACTVHIHHSHRIIIVVIFFNQCYFVCPVVCFILCTSFDRESWHYLPKFRSVSCDILVCIIYVTDFDFRHYKPRIQILFFCKLWHIELQSSNNLLFNNVSFQPYVSEVRLPFLVPIFTFHFYTCFPFSSVALERFLSTTSCYFPDVMANGLLICLSPLCWGVSSHTRHSLIYWVQTTVITEEALLHMECFCSILQLVNYHIVDLWSSNS